jgi:hypothetical protein
MSDAPGTSIVVLASANEDSPGYPSLYEAEIIELAERLVRGDADE